MPGAAGFGAVLFSCDNQALKTCLSRVGQSTGRLANANSLECALCAGSLFASMLYNAAGVSNRVRARKVRSVPCDAPAKFTACSGMQCIGPKCCIDAQHRPGDEASLCIVQADLWQFYLEPSLYGREVPTAGGARGPGRAYYVPMLSGLQLFRSMANQDEADDAAGQGSDVFQARGSSAGVAVQHVLKSSDSVKRRPVATRLSESWVHGAGCSWCLRPCAEPPRRASQAHVKAQARLSSGRRSCMH